VIGSRGVALMRTRDINQPVANLAVASGQLNPNAARPYPGFAGITCCSRKFNLNAFTGKTCPG
jgi:hypothetical protein